MDQARYYVCESCMTPVPSGHKFCGRCGTSVPDAVMHLHADFYGDMQDPAKARLILIRGEGMDGLSYHLKADQHLLGRQGQLEFPDDKALIAVAMRSAYSRLTLCGSWSLAPGRRS